MHAMLKHDSYLYCIPFVSHKNAVLSMSTLSPLIDESWMISMDVVIHPLRCGLAIVFRCQGLSKVRCGGEGLVLHGVCQVLESAKDLFLGVDHHDNMCHHVSGMERTVE
jgi:hypothetical protein